LTDSSKVKEYIHDGGLFMQSTYRLKANELSSDIIRAVKNTYHDREIEITISEVFDETDYLMASPVNREHLFAAMEDIKNNRNLVHIPLDSLP
jgi:hypothetical protein